MWLNSPRLHKHWPVKRKVYEFHLWGRCPACNHDTQGLFSLYTATASSIGGTANRNSLHANQPAAEGDRQALGVQQCACVKNHPPTPPATAQNASTFGCGASWLVGVRYNTPQTSDNTQPTRDPKFFVPMGQLEAEFWQSSKHTADKAPKALSKIQKAAKGWSTALGAIIALVSLSSIIGGRDTLAKLGPNIQWAIVVLSGLALISAAAALYLSALANLGLPSLKRVSSPTRMRDNDLGPLHKAAYAAASLKIATKLAVVSFLTALGALGIFVEAPDAPSAPSNNEITISGVINSATCGSITVYASDPKLISFTPKGAFSPTHVVPATAKWKVGKSC
jgi:hypothetical protein